MQTIRSQGFGAGFCGSTRRLGTKHASGSSYLFDGRLVYKPGYNKISFGTDKYVHKLNAQKNILFAPQLDILSCLDALWKALINL